VVRSHYLPLFSRLGNYSCDVLDQAAWSQGRRRTLFEYWGHEASLLPLAMYPLMAGACSGRAWRGHLSATGAFGREQQASSAGFWPRSRSRAHWVPAVCRPARSKAGPWWDWSAEKHALEWLFAAGEVTVAGRRGLSVL
jgi:uncharacterized protein YcaQ